MDILKKELALYALRYAKDIIEFQHRTMCSAGVYFGIRLLDPPLTLIDDAIEVISGGKLPKEDR